VSNSEPGTLHEVWMPDDIRDETPVYDGTAPLPKDECGLCEKHSPEVCGYHSGAIFYCSRCGRFLVHRAGLVPPEKPGGAEIAKSCHCPDLDDVGVFDTQRMQYIGYEATVDPRIKARTPGVRDSRKKVVTACRFCAVQDLDERNDADYIVQLRCDHGTGVTADPICDDCRRAHGWSKSEVRELIRDE